MWARGAARHLPRGTENAGRAAHSRIVGAQWIHPGNVPNSISARWEKNSGWTCCRLLRKSEALRGILADDQMEAARRQARQPVSRLPIEMSNDTYLRELDIPVANQPTDLLVRPLAETEGVRRKGGETLRLELGEKENVKSCF